MDQRPPTLPAAAPAPPALVKLLDAATAQAAPAPVKLHDAAYVCDRIGVRKTKLYDLIARGLFPVPHKIGTLSRWRSDDIDAWINRVAPRSEVA